MRHERQVSEKSLAFFYFLSGISNPSLVISKNVLVETTHDIYRTVNNIYLPVNIICREANDVFVTNDIVNVSIHDADINENNIYQIIHIMVASIHDVYRTVNNIYLTNGMLRAVVIVPAYKLIVIRFVNA